VIEPSLSFYGNCRVKFGRKLKNFSETTRMMRVTQIKKLRGEPSAFRKHSLGENRKDIDVDVRRRRDFANQVTLLIQRVIFT